MRVLFVHDCKMNYNSDGKAQPIELQKRIRDRYIAVFGSIRYLVRKGAEVSENDYCPGFECRYLEDMNSPVNWLKKYRKNTKALTEEIITCNGAVCKLPSINGAMAAKILRKQGKPYIVEVVGCPWDSYWNHSIKGKIVAPVMWFITRQAVKNAPYVLYVSEKFLQKRYPTRGEQTACSDVLLTAFDESLSEERDARLKSKAGEAIVLGTAAAVNVRYKGQQYVMKAMAILKKQGYKIKYRLVGGGDDTYLKNVANKYGVSEDVEFIGTISHDKIPEFMDSVDIYLQPSNQEGLPRAVVEAMSRACPVIGSSTGGIPELVPPECVFKRKNVKDLTRVLKKVIDQKCDGLSQKSLERAKDFEKDKLDKKRTEFYKSFIEDAKQ